MNLWYLLISYHLFCSFDGFGELNQHKNFCKINQPNKPNPISWRSSVFDSTFSGPSRWMLSNRLRPDENQWLKFWLFIVLAALIVVDTNENNWHSSNLQFPMPQEWQHYLPHTNQTRTIILKIYGNLLRSCSCDQLLAAGCASLPEVSLTLWTWTQNK